MAKGFSPRSGTIMESNLTYQIVIPDYHHPVEGKKLIALGAGSEYICRPKCKQNSCNQNIIRTIRTR